MSSQTLYISNIVLDNQTGVYTLMLTTTPKMSRSYTVLKAKKNFTLNYSILANLNIGDCVDVDYDAFAGVIYMINMPKAPVTTSNLQVYTSPQHTSIVYYQESKLMPAAGGILGKISVSLVPSCYGIVAGNLYEMIVASTTVLHFKNLHSIPVNTKLEITYDSHQVLSDVKIIEGEESEIGVDELESPSEDIEIMIDEKDWINLCTRDMMFRCGVSNRDARKDCYFYGASIGKFNDCCFHRESIGHACDCIKAHQHYKEHKQMLPKERVVKEEPDISYDELLRKRIGKRV